MCDKSVDAALEFFEKRQSFKLTDFDWRFSEVKPESVMVELELDETKPLDRGLARKFVSEQSITDCTKELGLPDDKSRFLAVASGYISVVTAMIRGRLEEGTKDKVSLVMKDNSFFQSMDSKQKLCFLEHCKADAAKALDATGRTIDALKNSGPII